MNKEVEELLKKIEEKEKIIRKYELLLDRFKILDEQENADSSEALDDIEEIIEELHERKVYGFAKKFARVKHTIMELQEQKNVLEIIKELISKNCKIELIDGGTYYQIRIKVIGSDYTFGMSINEEEFELANRWIGKDKSE